MRKRTAGIALSALFTALPSWLACLELPDPPPRPQADGGDRDGGDPDGGDFDGGIPGPAVCGDGRLQGGEACDDGNRHPLDGCDSGCAVEEGAFCRRQPFVEVVNGSFEAVDPADCPLLSGICPQMNAVDVDFAPLVLPGWELAEPTVGLQHSSSFVAAHGFYSVDLAGDDPGELCQTLATTESAGHVLSFAVAANCAAAAECLRSATVTATDVPSGLQLAQAEVTATQTSWRPQLVGEPTPEEVFVIEELSFIAASGATKICFRSLINDAANASGIMLDAVVVAESVCVAGE